MTVNWNAVAAVLDAIAWPLTVTLAVLVLKKPLVEGLPSLVGRATKITLRDVGIELSPARELAPTWSTANIDVRRLTSSDVFDSNSMSLFQQLSEPSATDYAIVDLGLGDKWLSSRLFIFAVVLGQVSNLKAFVFIETRNGVTRSFIGVADPASVYRVLRKAFPWFEASLLSARIGPGVDPKTISEHMDLNSIAESASWRLTDIVRTYVAGLQQSHPPPDGEQRDWEEFTINQPMWERTHWLDGLAIQELLGDSLDRSSYVMTPDATHQAKIEGILRRPARYVAILDEKERFTELVDRAETVEQLVNHVLERSAPVNP